MWRWWSDEGWVYYSLENSAVIEKSWRKKEVNIIINVGGIPFLLNLRHFYQFNFITQRHRRISRDISSAVWFWTDNDDQLNLYQPNVSAQIERFYLHIQWNLYKESQNDENSHHNHNNCQKLCKGSDALQPAINNELVKRPKSGDCVVWNQYDIYPIECVQVNRITGKERKIYRRYLKKVEYELTDNSQDSDKENDFNLEWEFTDTSKPQIQDALSIIVETGEFNCEGYSNAFTKQEIDFTVSKLLEQAQVDDDCCLCLDALNRDLVKLNKCSHVFHSECLNDMISHLNNKTALLCPLCMTPQCFGRGNSPPGKMRYIVYKSGNIEIESYPNTNVIEIEYFIPSGIQNQRHPSPNKLYTGTYKIAYLPFNKKGLIMLDGLAKAFQLGHTFKVNSITNPSTGSSMEIVQWGNIPHKISTCGGPALHGFPDPNFFTTLMNKLSSLGIKCKHEESESHSEIHE
ncbi:ring finger-containing protein [Cryptosporidium hominis]